MLILVLELKKMPIFTLVCGASKRNGIKIVFFMVTVGKGMYYHYVGRGYQPWGPMCTIQGCCFGNVHNNTLSMEMYKAWSILQFIKFCYWKSWKSLLPEKPWSPGIFDVTPISSRLAQQDQIDSTSPQFIHLIIAQFCTEQHISIHLEVRLSLMVQAFVNYGV